MPTARFSTWWSRRPARPEQLAIREANMGIYCFRADLFWKHVDEIQPNNPAREYYLTDMPAILTRAGHRVEAMRIDDPGEALGINDRAQLAMVDAIFRERKRSALMAGGVTVDQAGNHHHRFRRRDRHGHDRGAVRADPRQAPRSARTAASAPAPSFRIPRWPMQWKSAPSPWSTRPYWSAARRPGPYARLRMDNHVEAGAHVGNFVELKKTRMGAGAKAGHLAYLGDSDIGAKVNIGAGTITCNYDGYKKHPTRIGEGAFVGSNSTLVAPLEIGAGAYVAAGSVITQAVPPDALAIGRGRQENKPEWARKRRKLAKTVEASQERGLRGSVLRPRKCS